MIAQKQQEAVSVQDEGEDADGGRGCEKGAYHNYSMALGPA
jgi:hypothetical protein